MNRQHDRSAVNLDGSPHENTAIEHVFAHWQRAMDKPRSRLDGKRARLIARRLAEYGEPELIAAINGCRSALHVARSRLAPSSMH